MKKTLLFIIPATFFICSCREGGRSDRYGNSEDTTGYIYSKNGAGHDTPMPVSPDLNSGARPNPDTSSFYDNSATKKGTGKETPK